MLYEEIILRQKRTDLERLATRQRLLGEAGVDDLSRLRRRLALVLLAGVKKLEPELEPQREVKYTAP